MNKVSVHLNCGCMRKARHFIPVAISVFYKSFISGIIFFMMPQVQASRVKYIDDAIAADPNDHDHIMEREFVDEICEAHAKPGEAVYNSSHDMDLSGDQG